MDCLACLAPVDIDDDNDVVVSVARQRESCRRIIPRRRIMMMILLRIPAIQGGQWIRSRGKSYEIRCTPFIIHYAGQYLTLFFFFFSKKRYNKLWSYWGQGSGSITSRKEIIKKNKKKRNLNNDNDKEASSSSSTVDFPIELKELAATSVPAPSVRTRAYTKEEIKPQKYHYQSGSGGGFWKNDSELSSTNLQCQWCMNDLPRLLQERMNSSKQHTNSHSRLFILIIYLMVI